MGGKQGLSLRAIQGWAKIGLRLQNRVYSCFSICLLIIALFIIINLLLPTLYVFQGACWETLGVAGLASLGTVQNLASCGQAGGAWRAHGAARSQATAPARPAPVGGMLLYRGCCRREGEGQEESLRATAAKK